MAAGATLTDPRTVWFSHDTKLASDVVVQPCVVFGPGVEVGPGATIHSFSHLEGAKVGAGRARIILEASHMHDLQAGEVLVTDITDPDWEPVMKIASAIVTNRGGRVCHAAIVARELGIPEDRWVFMHGAAQGTDVDVSVRPTPCTSVVAGAVLDKALNMAACTPADIHLIDIYSCFPCAVSEISDHLRLPADGSVPLTLTGGLPFFGGPGNNYSMHGLAEMVWQLRKAPGQIGLVHANGGFLTKHAAGIFSCVPSTVDWTTADTRISPDATKRCERANNPETGVVISYCINFYKGAPATVIVLAETDAGQRFVCSTAPTDNNTAQRVLAVDPTGARVAVVPGEREHSWYLRLVSDY